MQSETKVTSLMLQFGYRRAITQKKNCYFTFSISICLAYIYFTETI